MIKGAWPKLVARRIAGTISVLLVLGAIGAPLALRFALLSGVPSRSEVSAAVQANGAIVAGIGDSVMSGFNCADCTTFLQAYTAQRFGSTGEALNFGIPGQTAAGLSNLLQRDQGKLADAVAQADVIVICVGANDAGADPQEGPDAPAWQDIAATAASVRQSLTSILERIDHIRGGTPVELKVLNYWSVYADGAVAADYGQGYADYARAMTAAINAAIATAATGAGASVVDTYTAFKGPEGTGDDTALLGPDGDHPNQAGHDVIAAAIAATDH